MRGGEVVKRSNGFVFLKGRNGPRSECELLLYSTSQLVAATKPLNGAEAVETSMNLKWVFAVKTFEEEDDLIRQSGKKTHNVSGGVQHEHGFVVHTFLRLGASLQSVFME